MKAKKIIGLCLAAALVVGMVGCQSATSNGGNNTQQEASAEKVTLKIGQTNFAAHGTKAFAMVTAVVNGDETNKTENTVIETENREMILPLTTRTFC